MNTSMIMVIMMLVVISILVGGGLYVKKMLVVTDPNTETSVESEDAATAQDFLPFVDIDGNMIDLGNHRYRCIIECSSVNYHLKTETERDVIEMTFQKFISSLSFPITFHIQTRIVDNTLIVRELEKDVERVQTENPRIYNYARTYLESMRNFDMYIGNVKQKKKYIIVGYEDAYILGDLNDSEKRELSRQQIRDRVSFIISQLSSMQIKAHCLNESELMELLYNSYHREDSQYDISEMLGMGGYTTIRVEGEDKLNKIGIDEKIDLELLRVQNFLKEECLDIRLGYEQEVYEEISKIYNGIKSIRDSIGSPLENNYSINIYDKEVKSKEAIKYESVQKELKNQNISNYDNNELKFNSSSDESNIKSDVLNFDEGPKDNEWELGFDLEDSNTNSKSDVLSFDEGPKDNEWELGFDLEDSNTNSKSDVLSFDEGPKDNEWELGFDLEDSNTNSKSDVLSFDEGPKDNEWELGFDLEDNDTNSKSDVLSFDEGPKDNEWELGFDLEDNDTNSKSDVLSFDEDTINDSWSLEFDDEDKLDYRKNDSKTTGNKRSKNSRLTMFD